MESRCKTDISISSIHSPFFLPACFTRVSSENTRKRSLEGINCGFSSTPLVHVLAFSFSLTTPTKPNLRFASKGRVTIAVERPLSRNREGYEQLWFSWIGLRNIGLRNNIPRSRRSQITKGAVAKIGKIFFHGSRSTRAQTKRNLYFASMAWIAVAFERHFSQSRRL